MSSVDLSKLHDRAQVLAALALDLGWIGRNQKNAVIFTSPIDHTVTVAMPVVRQWNDSKLRTIGRKIVRYADPVKTVAVLAKLDKETGMKFGENDALIRVLLDASASVPSNAPDQPIPEPELVPEDTPEPPSAPRQPQIVSSQPWLARSGAAPTGGRVYPSEAVLERRWNDGSRDYACSWPDCDYSNVAPRAVANHYARSKSHQVIEEPRRFLRDPQYVEPVFPNRGHEARVTRLATELAKAMELLPASVLDTDDTATLARQIAAQVIAARVEAHAEDPEAVPPTAEQLVERIRRLVDDGSYLRALDEQQSMKEQLAEQSARIETLTSDLAVATVRLTGATEQAQRATERWEALRSLITEES